MTEGEEGAQDKLREASDRATFERELARVWRETYDQVPDPYGEDDDR